VLARHYHRAIYETVATSESDSDSGDEEEAAAKLEEKCFGLKLQVLFAKGFIRAMSL